MNRKSQPHLILYWNSYMSKYQTNYWKNENIHEPWLCTCVLRQYILPDCPVLDLMKRWVSLNGSKKQKQITNASISSLLLNNKSDCTSVLPHLFGEGSDVFVEWIRRADVAVTRHAGMMGCIWQRAGVTWWACGQFTLLKHQGQEWKQRVAADIS